MFIIKKVNKSYFIIMIGDGKNNAFYGSSIKIPKTFV